MFEKIVNELKKENIDDRYLNNAFKVLSDYLEKGEKDVLKTPYGIAEACPHCDSETEIADWNIERQGFVCRCSDCGEKLMICSECHSLFGHCNWRENSGCFADKLTEIILRVNKGSE